MCFVYLNRFDPKEKITDGIDASCYVSVEQARNWNADLPQGKNIFPQFLLELNSSSYRLRMIHVDL